MIDVESGDAIKPSFLINHVAFNALKRTSETSFAGTGSTSTASQSFFHFDITELDDINVLKASVKVDFPETCFPPARNIKFPRNHGAGGEYAYGISFPQQAPNAQLLMEPFHP